MSFNQKCAHAVATILAAHATSAAFGAAPADDAAAAGGVTEVVVTAQRRSENIQDVPIAIQAFTGDTLQQLNVANFDDFVKYLPNVSASSSGPGQSNIYMRGLSVGNQGIQSGGSINGFPNVAVYLDDQCWKVPRAPCSVRALRPA
jgi:outer membrane receptor protein involved in Fe transport